MALESISVGDEYFFPFMSSLPLLNLRQDLEENCECDSAHVKYRNENVFDKFSAEMSCDEYFVRTTQTKKISGKMKMVTGATSLIFMQF